MLAKFSSRFKKQARPPTSTIERPTASSGRNVTNQSKAPSPQTVSLSPHPTLTSFNNPSCGLHTSLWKIRYCWKDLKFLKPEVSKVAPECSCDLSSAMVLYRPVIDPRPVYCYKTSLATSLSFGAISTERYTVRRPFAVLLNDSEKFKSSFEQAREKRPGLHSEESFTPKDLVEAGIIGGQEIYRAEVCAVCDMYNPVHVTLNPFLVGKIIETKTSRCFDVGVPEVYKARDFLRFSKVCVSCDALGIKDSQVSKTKRRFVEEYRKEVVNAAYNMMDKIHKQVPETLEGDAYYEKAYLIHKAAALPPVVYSDSLDSAYARATKCVSDIMALTMNFGFDDIHLEADIGELLDRAYEKSLEEEDCSCQIVEPTPRPDVIRARASSAVLEHVLEGVLTHNYENLRSSPSRHLVYRPDRQPAHLAPANEQGGSDDEFGFESIPEDSEVMFHPADYIFDEDYSPKYVYPSPNEIQDIFTCAYLNHQPPRCFAVARGFLDAATPILLAFRKVEKGRREQLALSVPGPVFNTQTFKKDVYVFDESQHCMSRILSADEWFGPEVDDSTQPKLVEGLHRWCAWRGLIKRHSSVPPKVLTFEENGGATLSFRSHKSVIAPNHIRFKHAYHKRYMVPFMIGVFSHYRCVVVLNVNNPLYTNVPWEDHIGEARDFTYRIDQNCVKTPSAGLTLCNSTIATVEESIRAIGEVPDLTPFSCAKCGTGHGKMAWASKATTGLFCSCGARLVTEARFQNVGNSSGIVNLPRLFVNPGLNLKDGWVNGVDYSVVTAFKSGWKMVNRPFRWCHHLTTGNYSDDRAIVVAETEGFVLVVHETQATIWSTTCVPSSQVPLKALTYTSKLWMRSTQDHDHRWFYCRPSVRHSMVSIPPGLAAVDTSTARQLMYAGSSKLMAIDGYSKKDPGCKHKAREQGKEEYVYNNRRYCQDCWEMWTEKRDLEWPDYVKLDPRENWGYDIANILRISRYCVKAHHIVNDVFVNGTCHTNAVLEAPQFWVCHLWPFNDCRKGSVLHIRPKHGTPLERYIQFPFDVYVEPKVKARTLSDVSFFMSPLVSRWKRIPKDTVITMASLNVVKTYKEMFSDMLVSDGTATYTLLHRSGLANPLKNHGSKPLYFTSSSMYYRALDGDGVEGTRYWDGLPNRFELQIDEQDILYGANIQAGTFVGVGMPKRVFKLGTDSADKLFLPFFDVRPIQDRNPSAVGRVNVSRDLIVVPWHKVHMKRILDHAINLKEGKRPYIPLMGEATAAAVDFSHSVITLPHREPVTTIAPHSRLIMSPLDNDADRALLIAYEKLDAPSIHDFTTMCDTARSRTPIPSANFYMGLGWTMKQGVGYLPLEARYRGSELSIFRQPENDEYIHNFRVPVKLPYMRLSLEIRALSAKIEEIASKFDGKVMITACPDSTPPPASVGFAPIAINGTQPGWINIPFKVRHGRENAFLRLVVMLTGDDVKDWWIVNGRDVELQLLPSLIPGRLCTANRYDTAPLVLYSTRSNLKFPQHFEFQPFFEMSFGYGLDEVVLKNFPLTVEVLQAPTPANCLFFPLGEGWPDVEILQAKKKIFQGRLNRLTIQAVFERSARFKVPPAPKAPVFLNHTADRALQKLESRLEEAPVLTDILSEFEGKNETILFVAYGTRGDILPVQYLANIAHTLGFRVAFYLHKQISDADLRAVIAGDIRGQLKNAFGLLGIGKTGFLGYVSPQLRISENSISFELTPWEFTAPIQNGRPIVSFLLNLFIATKSPDLKIGTVLGSNTPRAVSAREMLRIRLQDGSRAPKTGWVRGSGGIEAVPKQIRDNYEEITSTDHNGTAFIGYTHVWCTGGQGIMQTLRAKGVVPLIYDPGFDRTLLLPHDPRYLKECDFSFFVSRLQRLGGTPTATPTYISRLKTWYYRKTDINLVSLLRSFVLVWMASGYIKFFFAQLASFPGLLSLARTPFMTIPWALLYLVWKYPLLATTTGVVPTVCLILLSHIISYGSKCLLAGTHHTYLVVQTQRKFPPLQHMKIVDMKRGEQAHMAFLGGVPNLKNPFVGTVEKATPREASQIWIPVPINFPKVAERLLLRADRYSPWFNCQVVLPSATSWDLIVCIVVAMAQSINFPFVFIAYMWFLVAHFLKFDWANAPPSSFYRFGTEEEYQELEAKLEMAASARREQEQKIQEVQLALRGKAVPVRKLISQHPSIRAIVTIEEEEDIQKFMPPKPASAIELNDDWSAHFSTETILSEAIRELKENPDLYSLDDFILHAAILAEGAKEQGMPDDHAYHGAVLALHDFIMAAPVPDEVDEWRKKFVPLKRVGWNLNRWLQELSKFMHIAMSELPAGMRSFLSAFYRWVEGVGSRIRTFGVQAYHICSYIGDMLITVSRKLWESFSDLVMPLIDELFGGKLSKRIKAVWALGGVARNPILSNQRRLQEMYAFASYERHEGFNTAYAKSLEEIISHLPESELSARSFPNSRYPDRLDKSRRIHEPTREKFNWFTKLREQYRPANAPKNPVMGITEAIAAYMEKDQTDPDAKEIRMNVQEIMDDKSLSEADKFKAVHSSVAMFLSKHEDLSAISHDAYLTQQVVTRLRNGSKQTVDHMHEVKRHPATMFEMQERYAYLGLKFDPKEERIPDTFADLDEDRKRLYDEIARNIVGKWPERYQDRKLTRPEALMNYLEWGRGSGPMFEMSYEERLKATAHMKATRNTQAYPHDTTKRFRMWESGLGAAVLRKAYDDAVSGKVDVQQFAAFVKSQPTPVAKLARGVTFMPITQWFKGMMECFAQNQRVTWRTTYIGKNMPGGQHMREFFEKVRMLPVVGEGDATQMDSRFEAGILYGLGRIAHHAWTWGSPKVENGAAIASHKAERYKALADGWIFNLHVAQRDGLRPRFHLVNALNRTYEGTPVEISVDGSNRFFFTKDTQLMTLVKTAYDELRTPGEYTDENVPSIEQLARQCDISRDRIIQGARLDPSINARPMFNNITQKIRGGATGLEDTTDLNTDGKKIGTIAALVTFGRLIGHPISVKDAMDESKYIEAHTSDDNIFGIDPLRLYGISAEEFHSKRQEFMQAFSENNLNMTFLFHEGMQDGVRGRFLEYLSYFSRPLTMQDRRHIQAVNESYRSHGIFSPDKRQNELLDPLSGLPPTDVVYINTTAMDARQTAQNAYKQRSFRDRYLLATIQRDIGQAQLKAFNFQSYLANLSTYHTNAARYLAAAAFPQSCRHQGRIPIVPTHPDELEFIQAHFHEQADTVGKKGTYARYRIDGIPLKALWRKKFGDTQIPDEFIVRLRELKNSQFPAYSKIVYDHFKLSKTPADKATKIWNKINRDVLGVDEGLKEVVDTLRRTFEKIPKKFTRGVTPTLDMVHPDEIWEGSGRIEAAIYIAYEKKCLDAKTMPTLGGFSRLVNQSPYAGCCNAAAAFHKFNTPEGAAELHEHPEWVWRNATVMVSIMYGFTWFVEQQIMKLPFIGLAWACMMFYLIDVTKVYSVIGLLRWHTIMMADVVIAGLLPRDVYIHSKRFSDFLAQFVPMQFFYVLNFVAVLDIISPWFTRIAMFFQHAYHFTPMTSTQPGAVQNEWAPIASTILDEVYAQIQAGQAAVASVKGPTGTGKSTFFVYELMRLNLLERGGRTFLVAPFTVLRDDWSLPSWFAMGSHDTPEHEKSSRYQVLKGNVVMRPNATIFLATYGHFQQRIQSGEITERDIVLFDEGHLGGPAQVMCHKLLERLKVPIVYLSATPAPVKGIDQGPVIDATNIVTQKNRKKVVVFPESTNQVTMLQEMLRTTDIDPQLGYSHRDMTQRCIMKVNTIADIAKTIEALNELRKADPGIPQAWEFSRNTFKIEKEQREAACMKGSYIIVATDIIGVGYDIKPPAYSIIDTGLTIQEHQGYLQRPANSTRDQMEQFHGRVGRNSSDRNGLVYCTANAGTGIPAQQYGSGSFYVNPEVSEAIGVPLLQGLPYQGIMRDFNYFDVKTTISGPLRTALVFTFLAALSGVDPREMPTFYRRYAELNFTLPEEYEWLSGRLAAAGQVALEYPAWSVVNTVILQNPFIVKVQGNNIVGREDGPEPDLSYCGPIYPRAGQWMSYYELSQNKNTIRCTGKITSESEAFEEMRKTMEEEIDRLREKLARRSDKHRGNVAKLKNMPLEDVRADLKDQLSLRNATINLIGATSAIETAKAADEVKSKLLQDAFEEGKAEAKQILEEQGQIGAIARQHGMKIDREAASRHIAAAIGNRRQRRQALNDTEKAKWFGMTHDLGWDTSDCNAMWEKSAAAICEFIADKDKPVSYYWNTRVKRHSITWKSQIEAETTEQIAPNVPATFSGSIVTCVGKSHERLPVCIGCSEPPLSSHKVNCPYRRNKPKGKAHACLNCFGTIE